MPKKVVPISLYWVCTSNHSEDMFILSKRESTAEKFHEDMEGFDDDAAYAELVLRDVEDKLLNGFDQPRYPTEEELIRMGFKQTVIERTAWVLPDNRMYIYGDIVFANMQRLSDEAQQAFDKAR